MKVLLTSHGSTGDIYPIIRLGRALIEAGHQVRFATAPFFRFEVEAAGIDFVSLPPDWDQDGFGRAMRQLAKARNGIDTLRIIYSEALPFIDDIIKVLMRELKSADVFVSNYIFANLCTLARSLDVPCAVTTFAHNVVPSGNYPPRGIPSLVGLPSYIACRWNRTFWYLADRAVCWVVNRAIGEAIKRHGIARSSSFLLNPADRILVTVSAKFFEPKILWSTHFKFIGYLRWQSPVDLEIEADLTLFCKNQRVPILTFGSVAFDDASGLMERFIRCWPNNKKIIIQSGWAGLNIKRPSDNIKFVGRISHDQLFKHASMVIHHGGAGTTASVLHAGIPNIIIPHIGDQWFFASEIKRMGVGLRVRRKRWPENLPKAVREVENSAEMKVRALYIAQQLAEEDGPGNAVRELESLFDRKGKTRQS